MVKAVYDPANLAICSRIGYALCDGGFHHGMRCAAEEIVQVHFQRVATQSVLTPVALQVTFQPFPCKLCALVVHAGGVIPYKGTGYLCRQIVVAQAALENPILEPGAGDVAAFRLVDHETAVRADFVFARQQVLVQFQAVGQAITDPSRYAVFPQHI